MADKSTAKHVDICEGCHVMISNVNIPTYVVILEMHEDENLPIIFEMPFYVDLYWLSKSKVTFNVKGKAHTIYLAKKNPCEPLKQNARSLKVMTITIGTIEPQIPPREPVYQTIVIRSMPIKVDVT